MLSQVWSFLEFKCFNSFVSAEKKSVAVDLIPAWICTEQSVSDLAPACGGRHYVGFGHVRTVVEACIVRDWFRSENDVILVLINSDK